MGLFFRGIPASVLFSAKMALGPSFEAIETGTYKGSTAKKLTSIAMRETTIEANQEFYMKALKWVDKFDNLTLLRGDSGALIGSALPKADVNCMVWLDAHYSGGNTAGEHNRCPLMSELKQILPSRTASNTVVLIDDARGLIGASGWPLLSDLVVLLNEYGFCSIVIDDVLIASSKGSLSIFVENYSKSRTFSFERLGGRMSLVSGLVGILGIATRTAFMVKHTRFLFKK